MNRNRTDSADPALTVRMGGALALPAVLKSLGVDPAEVLAEAGVALSLFDDPDNRMSFTARNLLFNHCAARTGCAHFGLLVGQQGGLHSLGLVGLLVKSSANAGAALRSLVRYLHLHVRGAVTTLEIDNDLAVLSYDVYQTGGETTNQLADGAVASMFNIMRGLCGPEWTPSEVRLAHHEPVNIQPFRRFFRAPLRFDAGQNALVFEARWLNHALPETDPELRRLVQQQIDRLETEFADDLPGQLRRVLRTALMTRHARSDQIAALFSMHPRTLSRRLNDLGLSFQELLDEGRFEIARQMLQDSAMEVREIAAMLGYTDPSAFTRAFRRWSGTTPGQWRMTRNAGNRTPAAPAGPIDSFTPD